MSIKATLSVALGLFFLLVGASCAEEPAPQIKPKSVQKVETKSAIKMVELAAEGTKFAPAVTSEQIPEGAWMCEMGKSVHYAAKTKGDCPVCGMHLKEKMAAHRDHTSHKHP